MEDNPIGYGNPPKEYQWKAGQSGNPAGYTPGVPNRGTVLRRLMSLKTTFENPITEQQEEGLVEDAMAWGQITAAIGGNTQAYKEILDSVYGKLTDKQEIVLPPKTVIKIGGKRPKPDPAPDADTPAADD